MRFAATALLGVATGLWLFTVGVTPVRAGAAADVAVPSNSPSRLKTADLSWYRHVVRWNEALIDLSFLNDQERPAGKRGFVRAAGEKLVFEDGSEGRFWGTNVTAYALFQTPSLAVPVQAKRLSKLGFNLVRLHHHDSDWVGFNIFGKTYTGKLDETAMERIDWWIKCLKDEGIYVWLDLHTGREFRAVDNINGFDEIAQGAKKTKASGFNYINPDIEARLRELNAALLTRVNKFTNVSYADEPAIVAKLITNENDITFHFGNGFLPDKNVPYHNAIYMSAAKAFAAKTGLDETAVWQSWRPGASKYFLNDLEHAYNERMIAHLRGLGSRALLATTNYWGGMDLSSLPALTDGDIVDAHAYGETDNLSSDPRAEVNITHWASAAAVAGKPLTVTEWNVGPFPAFDRATLPPQMAAIASLQGWSGLMQYAYTQSNLSGPGALDNWTAANDPALIATLPVAALLYRQRHVASAEKTYVLTLTPDQLMGDVGPRTSRAIRTITESSKFRVAMPSAPALSWLKPSPKSADAIEVTDIDFDAIPAGATRVCSDTAEICRSWATGIMTVDTPRSQLAAGWLGGRPTELKSVSIGVTTPHAVVAVQSLDKEPIETSSNILITATAQSVPSPANRLPFLSEPVEGSVSIRAKAGLRATAIRSDGKIVLAASYKDGAYVVPLTRDLQTFWIMLSAQ